MSHSLHLSLSGPVPDLSRLERLGQLFLQGNANLVGAPPSRSPPCVFSSVFPSGTLVYKPRLFWPLRCAHAVLEKHKNENQHTPWTIHPRLSSSFLPGTEEALYAQGLALRELNVDDTQIAISPLKVALRQFFTATGGTAWKRAQGWQNMHQQVPFYGVITDPDTPNNVTELSLLDNWSRPGERERERPRPRPQRRAEF